MFVRGAEGPIREFLVLPFRPISPECGAHLSFCNILFVTRLEAFLPRLFRFGFWIRSSPFNTLLAKTNQLFFAVFFGKNGMAFSGVIWCALWLVIVAKGFSGLSDGHDKKALSFIIADPPMA